MAWPVPGYAINQAYGIKGQYWKACKFHTGADIAAPSGTSIKAPIAGTIRWRNYGSSFGRSQFVISPSAGQPFANQEVFFAHTLDRLPDGTEVKVGQHIARVGADGNATGPHLHIELHSRKQAWNCSVMQNPQPVLDWGGSAPPTTPAPAKWMFPSGHKVYQKYLKVDGHEQNADRTSDSIKALQEMLNRHKLVGGVTLPTSGKYWTATDGEVRKCQAQHLPPADASMKSYIGPKQWDHLKAATGAPYTWVADTSPPPTTPPPTTPPPATEKPDEPALLYPHAAWDPIAKTGGGYFTGLRAFKGSAKKITLHTTETASKPNWAQQQSGIPHFTVDLRVGNTWQHLPLDVAAYTMKGGDHSPNSDSGLNIQVEIIGFTQHCADWSTEEYAQLRKIVEWIGTNCGVPMEYPYLFDSPPRLSWAEWEKASGILGHCHAPYNDHSDPTGLDIELLLEGTDPPVEPPPVEPPPVEPPPVVEPPTSKAVLAIVIVALGVLLGNVLFALWADTQQDEPVETAVAESLSAPEDWDRNFQLQQDLGLRQEVFTDPVAGGWVPAFDFCDGVINGEPREPLHLAYLARYYANGGGPSFEIWLNEVVRNSCSVTE